MLPLYGQELVRKMSPYTREERKKLDLELSNLEKLVDHWMEYRVGCRQFKMYIYAKSKEYSSDSEKGRGNVSE